MFSEVISIWDTKSLRFLKLQPGLSTLAKVREKGFYLERASHKNWFQRGKIDEFKCGGSELY